MKVFVFRMPSSEENFSETGALRLFLILLPTCVVATRVDLRPLRDRAASSHRVRAGF